MTDKKKEEIQTMDFETAFIALQESIAELESTELPLDQALARFERGQTLAKRCVDLLDKAELKVQTLTMNTPQSPETEV